MPPILKKTKISFYPLYIYADVVFSKVSNCVCMNQGGHLLGLFLVGHYRGHFGVVLWGHFGESFLEVNLVLFGTLMYFLVLLCTFWYSYTFWYDLVLLCIIFWYFLKKKKLEFNIFEGSKFMGIVFLGI